MPTTTKAKITGMTVCLPDHPVSNLDSPHYTPEFIGTKEKITGVKTRYIANKGICTSDLCFAAAQNLIKGTEIRPENIGGIIFVSQTPDYKLPATACVLQHRLNLPNSVFAFDVNQGCSGYVYGLWLASCLIESKTCQHVLLLVGDTVTKFVNEQDKGTSLLFGDAGSATLISYDTEENTPMHFVLGTDGAGKENLIIPAGGFREQSSRETLNEKQYEDNSLRSRENLYMNGGEIFNFTITRIPTLIQETLKIGQTCIEDIDAFVFHQANKFMLNHLTKKAKIPDSKMWLSIENFGNTSSASIPLTITHKLKKTPMKHDQTLALFGFGVGYSWGGSILKLSKNTFIDLILLENLH
jgi:3-oxoacyl-[acyl-carrier-protein] synthase-3